MQLTTIGHAGLWIEAEGATILCDPWFTPAYLGSWFPFPRNDGLDHDALRRPDFLYVSHLHRDHFDPGFLSTVEKSTTVLLPEYGLPLLEEALRALGFRHFLPMPNGVTTPLGEAGTTASIVALTAPTDGPIGDSALLVADRSARICNLNDARPTDLGPFLAWGRLDALFLQTSGAIWYPMVYDFPPAKMRALGERKREAGMARALRLVELLDPALTVPFAGPPAFLDEELFAFNDLERDPANTFPDQTAFLDVLAAARGPEAGALMIPGSTITLGGATPELSHALGPDDLGAIFADKETYLRRYQADWAGWLAAERSSWGAPGVDVVGGIVEWFTPLMERAPLLSAEVGGTVLLAFGSDEVVLDFRSRRARPGSGEDFDHRFAFSRAIGEHLVSEHVEDWINDAFLSCRFQASRRVPHNDAVFTFFKCLSPERIDFAEAWLAELEANEEAIEIGGWRVQRRCPHGRADLSRFGVVAGDTLTCHLHGYCYDLATRACTTNPRLSIRAERLPPASS